MSSATYPLPDNSAGHAGRIVPGNAAKLERRCGNNNHFPENLIAANCSKDFVVVGYAICRRIATPIQIKISMLNLKMPIFLHMRGVHFIADIDL